MATVSERSAQRATEDADFAGLAHARKRPDPEFGQRLAAFVVRAKGASLDEEMVRATSGTD